MHVQDAAIYDVTFDVPTLRQKLESAEDRVTENVRQLPAVSAICNAASFEGSPSESMRNIIGDATGKWPIHGHFHSKAHNSSNPFASLSN